MYQIENNLSIEVIKEKIKRSLAETGKIHEISAEFAQLRTNHERVNYVYGLLEKYNYFPNLEKDGKNDEKSTKLRQEGNDKFKSKKLEESLKLYTQSVSLAKGNSENLGLAFANRSAVLLENGLYQECLTDIDRAIKCKYPENLLGKLLQRRERASKLLPNQKTESYHNAMPKIENKSETIQCSSKSIEIKSSEYMGRFVAATDDIEVGEIIVIEEAFIKTLISEYYTHCHECLTLCYNLIPCNFCSVALYCCESCKKRAWKTYHKYECPILKTIQAMEVDTKMLFLKIALTQQAEYSKLNKEFKINGDENDKIYCSDRYKEVHNLISNTEKRNPADLFERAVVAAVLSHLVQNYTDFFKDFNPEVENALNIFNELLLLHMQTGPSNFHEITELAENEDGIYTACEIGSGVYPFLSMLNHSCSPNVIRNDYGTTLVLRALHRIEKGEQLFDNYGYHFAINTKQERQARLKKQYYFDCECEACRFNWPMIDGLPENKEKPLTISDDGFLALTKCNIEMAQILLEVCLPKTKLKWNKPTKDIMYLEEVIKQCYAIFGNRRRTF